MIRCSHSMLRGLCPIATCHHWDGVIGEPSVIPTLRACSRCARVIRKSSRYCSRCSAVVAARRPRERVRP